MEPFRFSVGQLSMRSAGLFACLQSFSRPSASTRTRPCPFNFVGTRFSDGSDGDFARHCAAVFYFGLPLGKNLNGMLVEYGIFIASDLVMLALESRFPVSFAVAGNFVQPFFYCGSLTAYMYAMWTYEPASAPQFLSSGAGGSTLAPFSLGKSTNRG